MTELPHEPEHAKKTKPRVFCVDCRHHEQKPVLVPGEFAHFCRFEPQYVTSYVTRERKPVSVHCHAKNPEGECPDWEAKA